MVLSVLELGAGGGKVRGVGFGFEGVDCGKVGRDNIAEVEAGGGWG